MVGAGDQRREGRNGGGTDEVGFLVWIDAEAAVKGQAEAELYLIGLFSVFLWFDLERAERGDLEKEISRTFSHEKLEEEEEMSKIAGTAFSGLSDSERKWDG